MRRRGAIIGAVASIVVLVIWQVSSQNLALVALATAPAGAIGLLLARDSLGWRTTSEGGSPVSGWDALHREIDRSRRHERPFTVAWVSFPDEDFVGDVGELAATIARVRSHLRSIDVVWRDGSRIWLLMPESGRDGGKTALRRITGAAPETEGALWKLVVFPDDAMTFGALIAELDETVPVDLVSPPLATPPTAP